MINLNTCSLEELCTLPGIGPKKAEALMASRPFAKVEDIKQVRGIGPSTYEGVMGLVAVTVAIDGDVEEVGETNRGEEMNVNKELERLRSRLEEDYVLPLVRIWTLGETRGDRRTAKAAQEALKKHFIEEEADEKGWKALVGWAKQVFDLRERSEKTVLYSQRWKPLDNEELLEDAGRAASKWTGSAMKSRSKAEQTLVRAVVAWRQEVAQVAAFWDEEEVSAFCKEHAREVLLEDSEVQTTDLPGELLEAYRAYQELGWAQQEVELERSWMKEANLASFIEILRSEGESQARLESLDDRLEESEEARYDSHLWEREHEDALADDEESEGEIEPNWAHIYWTKERAEWHAFRVRARREVLVRRASKSSSGRARAIRVLRKEAREILKAYMAPKSAAGLREAQVKALRERGGRYMPVWTKGDMGLSYRFRKGRKKSFERTGVIPWALYSQEGLIALYNEGVTLLLTLGEDKKSLSKFWGGEVLLQSYEAYMASQGKEEEAKEKMEARAQEKETAIEAHREGKARDLRQLPGKVTNGEWLEFELVDSETNPEEELLLLEE